MKGNIRCAIFGQLVEAILGFLASPGTGLPVVIIQEGRVNLYKGEVGIQNVMNATEIRWNPDIPLLLSSRIVHEIETDVANSIISDRARPIYAREEFLQLYPRKKVGQLHEMVEEGFFIVMATIKEIVEEERWWYKIKVLVSAGDDNAHLIMFDSECFSLLNKFCRDLLSDCKVSLLSGYKE
ncbi:hypothetical protein SESBI_30043 [Sesbania bispinosa]|nr:hypothetical protein SESBI_30043 [Sesbania bispinosa]